LWLNGAPVDTTIDLDLGVPGYKYNVTANALAIPLAPLVNSFEPDRKGQLGGTLTADAKVAGIGTSGADLKKNLTGNVYVGTTNLNLSVLSIRNRMLKTLINVVAIIPEMVRNPDLGTALTALTSPPGAGGSGGLAGDLEKSPIDQIMLRGSVGSGKVSLQQALVQSPAFQANATGTVQLQDILNNSTIDIPVSLSLSQPIAQRLNLVPSNTPTNAAYVALPDFLTLTGTYGDPGRKINKLPLVGLAAKGLSGIGGKAGGILQGVSAVLGGDRAAGTNAPTTNKPSGNVGNLLQGLLGGGQSATNRPAGTTAPATNQSPVDNLLNNIFRQKK